jgi:hypothetical protein
METTVETHIIVPGVPPPLTLNPSPCTPGYFQTANFPLPAPKIVMIFRIWASTKLCGKINCFLIH